MKGSKKEPQEKDSKEVFDRVLADALEISDRFVAEPVFKETGKGYLKSLGVEEVRKAKRARENQ